MSSGLSLVTPPRVDDSSPYEYESTDRSQRINISDHNQKLRSNDYLKVKNSKEFLNDSSEKRSYSVSFAKNNESQSFRKRSDSYYRKRRYSFGTNGDQKHLNAKRRKDRIVLPTKFLLGGNITDPLNLSSLANSANQVTPQSSPLPTPKHKAEVEVLIPANINDPLNLYSNEDIDDSCLISPKTKNKSRKRKRKRTDSETTADHELEANVSLNSSNEVSVDPKKSCETPNKHPKHRFNDSVKSADKIVSPVIPQGSGPKHRRFGEHSKPIEPETSDHQKETKVFNKKSKKKKQKQSETRFREKDDRFRYGNYNRYYGYRNFHQKDCRLDSFKVDWFENKDILDIGCNVGHITLFVAKNCRPNKIIGLDIDNDLIRMANKNVRHYITSSVLQSQDFPISLPLFHGPLASNGDNDSKFPQNVCFIAGNYISESEDTLNVHKQQFDTILCLSLTKWVHLNWGDSGVKTLFKRIFSQLRPNGKLILEAQPFSSYKRKKKINETTFQNFRSLEFKPEQFNEYLLSREVGFSQSELVGTPANPSKDSKMSDKKVDKNLIERLTNLLDEHLIEFRLSVATIGLIGFGVVLRSIRFATKFTTIEKIPKSFIKKSMSLRGEVRSVSSDGTLNVDHIPIWRMPWHSRATNEKELLALSLAAIEPNISGVYWLKLNVENKIIWFKLMDRSEGQVSCIAWQQKSMPFHKNLNAELVERGLALVRPLDHPLASLKAYKTLHKSLIDSQRKAQRNNRGVWYKPNKLQVLKHKIEVKVDYLKRLKNIF